MTDFSEVDKMLSEVREQLTYARDAGELNELVVLQLLLQVTKELHGFTNVHDLITKVLDSALAFVDGERAFLLLLDEEGDPRFKMGRNAEGEYLSRETFSPSMTVIQQSLEEKKTLIITNAVRDAVLSKRQSIVDHQIQTIICSPLIIKKEPLGILYIDSRYNPSSTFSTRATASFVASLADQSAVAIRNAQKFETHS